MIACMYYHQRGYLAPTAVCRLDLLHSLLMDHTFRIDTHHTNTQDKAFCRGHYYSDKAPGTFIVALPAFAMAVGGLELARVPMDSNEAWLISSWAGSVGSLSVLTALGAGALFIWLSRRVQARAALLTVIAIFLGAAPLPYATLMFSHSLVVGCIGIALWAFDQEATLLTNGADFEAQRGKSVSMRHFWQQHRFNLLAGCACGWALASEYTAGLLIVGMTCYFLTAKWRQLAVFGFTTVRILVVEHQLVANTLTLNL
jgi:hypothetical protein